MKKVLIMMITAMILISSFLLPVNAASDSPVITFTASENEAGDITAVAVLRKNTGILSMTIEIVYDENSMTFEGFERGDALSSLEFVTTNPEKCYSVKPFRFLYEGEKNDNSTGTLLTLNFRLKDVVTDGKYPISFKYTRGKDLAALSDGSIVTKNLLIDSVMVHVKDNKTSKITIEEDKSESENLLLLWIAVPTVVIVCGTIAVVAVRKRRSKTKKTWVKL